MTIKILVVKKQPHDPIPSLSSLVEENYQMITMMHSKMTLAIIKKIQPNIALLDLGESIKETTLLCQSIRECGQSGVRPYILPIILSHSHLKLASKAGADDALVRPSTELLTRINVLSSAILKAETLKNSIPAFDPNKLPTVLHQQMHTQNHHNNTTKESILIIDDNFLQNNSILETIDHKNRHITQQFSYIFNEKKQRDIQYNVVIINLLDPSRKVLIHALRQCKSTKKARILGIIEHQKKELARYHLALGVDDYITYPIHREILKMRLQIQIKHQQHYEVLLELYQRNTAIVEHDALTNLYNRQYFNAKFSYLFLKAKQHHQRLYLALIDVDRFKRINDIYGHTSGDTILTQIAQCIVRHLPDNNAFAARYGGEEIAVVMYDCCATRALQSIRETLHDIQAQHFVVPHLKKTVTLNVSIGFASHLPSDHNTIFLINRTDHALYISKHLGGNQITLAPRS